LEKLPVLQIKGLAKWFSELLYIELA